MTEFVNYCAACGAEEGLDALLGRMIDDDTVRRLVADVLTASFPVGGLVVRYLRLFKPQKQKLRMDKVAKVLAELVPDVKRSAIERNGRTWMVGPNDWSAAFAAVFTAVDKGTLAVPLPGNSYLYSVLMRKADKTEGDEEKLIHQQRRSRTHQAGAVSVSDVLAGVVGDGAPPTPAADPLPAALAAPARARVESLTVRRFKAEAAAAAARKGGAA